MTKACGKCGDQKPLEDFYVRKRDSRPTSYGKPCHVASATAWAKANRDRRRAADARWRANNPTRRRESHIQASYGLSPGEYGALRDQQSGRCGACGDVLQGGRREAIDHNHETGAVRAILCCWCNKALGHAREDAERLRALAEYVEAHA